MTIGSRIGLSKAIMASLLILVGGSIFVTNSRVGGQFDSGLKRLAGISRLESDVLEIQLEYRRAVRAMRDAEEGTAKPVALPEKKLREKFEVLGRQVNEIPEGAQIAGEFDSNLKVLRQAHTELMSKIQIGDEKAIVPAYDHWQNAQRNIQMLMRDLVAMAKIDLREQYHAIAKTHDTLHFWLLVIILVAIAHVLLSLRHFMRTIVRPLKRLAVQSAEFARGNREKVQPYRSNDEMGVLFENVRVMQESVIHTEKHLTDSNKRLERFAAVAAHDLRSPLATGLMYLDSLNPADKLEGQENFGLAQRIFARSLETIESLLSLADKGTTISKTTVDCKAAVEEVCEDLAREIEASNAKIVRKNLGQLRANPGLVREMLRNLIANSIKYRDPDRDLIITVSFEPRVLDGLEYDGLLVMDTGRGFDGRKSKSLLKPFSRGDRDGLKGIEGTGLGLTICREIMQRHNGHFLLDSRVNEGTTAKALFPVLDELPVVERIEGDAEALSQKLDGKRVLVVDDDDLVRELLVQHLVGFGLTVEGSSSVEEALSKIQHEAFDFVLTDLRMPGGDGTELLQRVQELEPSIPVLLLSADTHADHRKHYLDLGFADCLQKGATPAMLLQAIRRCLFEE